MRFSSDLKSVYYLIVYSVLLLIIIYLSSDIYRLVELNIHSEEYVRSACPDGEKIRVNNPDYIPAIFENMTYFLVFLLIFYIINVMFQYLHFYI